MVYHKCCVVCGRILTMEEYEKGTCNKCTKEKEKENGMDTSKLD